MYREFWNALPEINIFALKIGHRKRKVVFQASIFRCYVSFREGIYTSITSNPKSFGISEQNRTRKWEVKTLGALHQTVEFNGNRRFIWTPPRSKDASKFVTILVVTVVLERGTVYTLHGIWFIHLPMMCFFSHLPSFPERPVLQIHTMLLHLSAHLRWERCKDPCKSANGQG